MARERFTKTMILEWLDLPGMDIAVRCDPHACLDLPGQLINLLEVSSECRVGSITMYRCDRLSPVAARSLEALLASNGRLRISEGDPGPAAVDEFGYIAVSQSDRLLFLRDERDEQRYSIFTPATRGMAEVTARIACLTAAVLGFAGPDAFEIRLCVHELLSNIVEHGTIRHGRTWIQTTLERTGESLCVSIVDKGIEFDPTARNDLADGDGLDGGAREGLGMMLLRRMHDSFRYERKNGYNRVYFNRTMSECLDPEQERKMMSFEIGEPVEFRDGMLRIELRGDLDSKGALAMETLLGSLLEKRLLSIVLDFEHVPFISNTGVGILLGMVSTIREEGGEARFSGMSRKVRSVLKLLNLQDYFKILDAEEAKA